MRAAIAAVYVAAILLANVLTEHLGLVPIGFGLMVTAGTFAAGLTLLSRNVLQDVAGRGLVLLLMALGVLLSWWAASPQLAVASAVAFGLSEAADMAIYSPLRVRGWARAALAAAAASAIVDTLAFLWLAGFPITADSVTGQVLVKFGVSGLVVVATGGARRALLR